MGNAIGQPGDCNQQNISSAFCCQSVPGHSPQHCGAASRNIASIIVQISIYATALIAKLEFSVQFCTKILGSER